MSIAVASEEEVDFFRDLAFFGAGSPFSDVEEMEPMRPLSLCSRKAIQMMGLRLLDPAAGLTVEEESKELAVFVWLHSAPLPEICAALWSGEWRAVLASAEPLPALLSAFHEWRAMVLLMLDAAQVHVRPKPKRKGDDTPKDLFYLTNLANTITLIAHASGFGREEIKWHIFLPEALQYFHFGLHWNGAWTVRRKADVQPAECDDLMPDYLQTPVPPEDVDSGASH